MKQLFEVLTFEGLDKTAASCDTFPDIDSAISKANELFNSGKHFGAEVIQLEPYDCIDPIKWIKTIED